MTDKLTYITIRSEDGEKLGSLLISGSVGLLWSYLEHHVPLKNYQHLSVAVTSDNRTSSSIYQGLVRSLESYTKSSKKSRMDSCTIIDIVDGVAISVGLKSSFSPIVSWTQISYHTTDGDSTVWKNFPFDIEVTET